LSDLSALKSEIIELSKLYGFQQAAVSNIDTTQYFHKFEQWIEQKFHGDMDYLERNRDLRKNPNELHPETSRIISLRYDYLPDEANFTSVLRDPNKANISRYAMGKDYHKLLRKKLQKLCKEISNKNKDFDYRVFVDSAPVLETAIAEKAGVGWKGKHTLVINKQAGSWFFLAEIFINIPLPVDEPVTNQCGNCTSCINLCPTNAIIAPYQLDARRCISYLTIENRSSIPVEFRKAIGNRIYGCDDCQLACPWNRFASTSNDLSFSARLDLDNISLLELFNWSESEFLQKLEGSPIRRIGYESWLRNIAVALGNGDASQAVIASLTDKRKLAGEMLAEHIDWAIDQLRQKSKDNDTDNTCLEAKQKNQKLIRTILKMLPRDA
jgi:epoxyqueuosine reductase